MSSSGATAPVNKKAPSIPQGIDRNCLAVIYNENHHQRSNEDRTPPKSKDLAKANEFVKSIYMKSPKDYDALKLPHYFCKVDMREDPFPSELLPLAAQCYTNASQPILVLVESQGGMPQLTETGHIKTIVVVVRASAENKETVAFKPTNDDALQAVVSMIRATKSKSMCNFHPYFLSAIYSVAAWGKTEKKMHENAVFPWTIANGGIEKKAFAKLGVTKGAGSGGTVVKIAAVPAPVPKLGNTIGRISIDKQDATDDEKEAHIKKWQASSAASDAFSDSAAFIKQVRQFTEEGATIICDTVIKEQSRKKNQQENTKNETRVAEGTDDASDAELCPYSELCAMADDVAQKPSANQTKNSKPKMCRFVLDQADVSRKKGKKGKKPAKKGKKG